MTRKKDIYNEAKKFVAETEETNLEEINPLLRVIMIACFSMGAKWADAHPHWISVEDDGNPIDNGWYIFTTGKVVDVGYYLGGNEWRDVHPTHWMPLPQAPKKGD